MVPLLAFALAIRLGAIAADPPLREPQMAVNGSTVGLVYGAGGAIFFQRSTDAGRTFSPAVRIAEAQVLPLNRHRGPRIAMSGGAIVVSAVVGRTLATGAHAHGLPSDGDLCAWRSTDNGTSWSECTRVNDVPGAPTEGLHSLAAGPNGKLFAAWLDKRGKGVGLYGAQSIDGGKTWSKNIRIYESPEGTICECCHPSAAYDTNGALWVMFRNWLAGSRDMYLTRSNDGATFAAAAKVGKGTWKLNACPMDGGGIAVVDGRVRTAWRKEKQIFLSRQGEDDVLLGEGVDVSVSGTYVAWTAAQGIAVSAHGAAPAYLESAGAFPNVVALPNGGALVAWESHGQIAVQALPK